MIRVAIPRYRLIESASHSKNFYVYIVEVSYGSAVLTLEKRYSDFHRLYKELQKQYVTGEFPPKKLRNTAQKVLDTRRIGLESWLQSVVQLPVIPPVVHSFLQLSHYTLHCDENNDTSPTHRPILSFLCDPFLDTDDTSSLPEDAFSSSGTLTNNVVKGVMTALYDTTLIFCNS